MRLSRHKNYHSSYFFQFPSIRGQKAGATQAVRVLGAALMTTNTTEHVCTVRASAAAAAAAYWSSLIMTSPMT